ncbi:CopD family copper resistance protein [Bordetella petrii]|uniref:CopD family copper resistance protein n=1 Tax=Bordetella petrii TaxID=94624 RepID=UPI00047DCEEC|nr:membrane protein [Bordetella petrii]
MAYPILLIVHLFAAIAFAGTVFFEIIMLEGVRRHVPREAMRVIEAAIGARARRIVPWIILALYGAGLGLAWQHRHALALSPAGSFGVLLWLKIALAASVFGHFVAAMVLQRRGRLNGRNSHRIHVSVFCHVLLIVLLAKGIFYLHW